MFNLFDKNNITISEFKINIEIPDCYIDRDGLKFIDTPLDIIVDFGELYNFQQSAMTAENYLILKLFFVGVIDKQVIYNKNLRLIFMEQLTEIDCFIDNKSNMLSPITLDQRDIIDIEKQKTHSNWENNFHSPKGFTKQEFVEHQTK